MFFRFRWQCLGLALAGVIVSVVVGGCSGPVPILLPDPTTPAQAETEQPLLLGGGVSVATSGNAASSSPGVTVGQSPVLRLLALVNRYAGSAATGCAPQSFNTVPDVTNIPLAQAQSNLLLQGLKVGNIRWAYSGTIPPGNVISQDPAAGKAVTPDTVVNLLASLGPQLAAVPDVAGRAQADAQSVITDAGFTVGTTAQTYSLTVAAGNVISQDPTAGTLAPPEAPVNLLISKGPQPVAVPNVTGQTQANAQQALLAAGLSVGAIAQGSSTTVPAGSVMGQNPDADAMVPPGTPVDLFVSQGPQPVVVPDIVGRTQSDAEATITGAGFSLGVVTREWSATVPSGSVVGQDPAAGTVMIPGTPISLVVSKGPQPTAVPNTAGMTQADAQAAITGAGLSVGAVTQEYSGTLSEGTVLSQNPAADTLLPPGGAVSLVVAKKTISLCDYYPFAVGNIWVTEGTNGGNGISAEVTDAFIINGAQCWKTTTINHSDNDNTTYSYAVEANGWMYQYKVLDDLFLLPGIAPSAQKVAPVTVTPGESFVTTFNGTSLAVTPVMGRLSDFVGDTSACPFGDVADTVALKLGNLPLIVFGRNLGPLYYNYITRSGFYSSITIVGGCGVPR